MGNVMPTIQQITEQKIIDNEQFRMDFLQRQITKYQEEFNATPTPEQLNWFIFEHAGISMEVDANEFNDALDNVG